MALGMWHFDTTKSTGAPLGAAVRLPGHIGQIISTTESYGREGSHLTRHDVSID